MTMDEFEESLKQSALPAGVTGVLAGLWLDGKGDFDGAHEIAQSGEGTREFDRLHAYLHRKEGDAGNARYWYRRAGAEVFAGSLEEEWHDLVAAHGVTP